MNSSTFISTIGLLLNEPIYKLCSFPISTSTHYAAMHMQQAEIIIINLIFYGKISNVCLMGMAL